MATTLRPCEIAGTCYHLDNLVPAVREDWKARCPQIAQKMIDISPEMGLADSECVLSVAQSWVDVQMAPELMKEGVR